MYSMLFTLIHVVYSASCHIVRLEAELKSVEEREGFSRWAEDSDTYRDFSRVATEKKKDEVLSDIATCARERWFLLKLKAKFAGLP